MWTVEMKEGRSERIGLRRGSGLERGRTTSDTPARCGSVGLSGTASGATQWRQCPGVLPLGLSPACKEITQPSHQKRKTSASTLSRHLPCVLHLGSAAFVLLLFSRFSPSFPPNCVSLSHLRPTFLFKSKRGDLELKLYSD